ncbi:nitrite reductase small subunit NirD [Neolewinella agarilytica]|uniref:Nitrite reductase (NADH) small subunit n=1 Tax=Neolewinella agarilytica TaxID=478744 RepID=A0A1H9I671_9BACT|nr:nitrite reductase small subunit NirD [Neolewinella agarilytica]SEQ70022.1 nitrite reductase (NADH) small subunit [Neolewinella agarilytica]
MTQSTPQYQTVSPEQVTTWFKAGRTNQFPIGAGATIKYGDKQIAVFYFSRQDRWYACQNLCPHKLENVLGRGLIGEQDGIPKVACPLHKKTFSLTTGENLNGECPPVAVYPVKVEDDYVYVGFAD